MFQGRNALRCVALPALGIAGLVILLAVETAWAEPTPPQPTKGLERTDAFEVAFGMSLFGYDGCGDRELGALFRRALLDRFNSCPFTNEARNRFQERTAAMLTGFDSQFQRYVAIYGHPPERLDGMKQSCAEVNASAEYLRYRETFERYARGEITIEQAIPDRCDTPAAYP